MFVILDFRYQFLKENRPSNRNNKAQFDKNFHRMLDDSDEESKSNLIAQALPVAQISSKNIDFSLPPATGEEYLLRVRHEASKNPIVVANVNLKKYEPKRTAQFYQEVAPMKLFSNPVRLNISQLV
jgi:hypothetical protein